MCRTLLETRGFVCYGFGGAGLSRLVLAIGRFCLPVFLFLGFEEFGVEGNIEFYERSTLELVLFECSVVTIEGL